MPTPKTVMDEAFDALEGKGTSGKEWRVQNGTQW
jgi:hypothetical protein